MILWRKISDLQEFVEKFKEIEWNPVYLEAVEDGKGYE